MNNTILPSNHHGPQVPIRVSRPAWKLWKYLESLYRIGGWISPELRRLARLLPPVGFDHQKLAWGVVCGWCIGIETPRS